MSKCTILNKHSAELYNATKSIKTMKLKYKVIYLHSSIFVLQTNRMEVFDYEKDNINHVIFDLHVTFNM